jgi:N-acetylmuramoyl-L-alanine amidase
MTYAPDSAVTAIVIHYSATPVEMDVTAEDIDTMHRRRGFKEIGYHWFIRKDGTVEMGRDLSSPGRFEVGAHSKGENSSSIGICFEGGVTRADPNTGFDSRTPAQKRAMIDLIQKMQARFPGAVVRGHRDMPGAATQCPGFDATAWWDEVQRKAHKPSPLAAIFAALAAFFNRKAKA